jgi:hypothetical protein
MELIIDRFSKLVKGTVFGFDHIGVKGLGESRGYHYRLNLWKKKASP